MRHALGLAAIVGIFSLFAAASAQQASQPNPADSADLDKPAGSGINYPNVAEALQSLTTRSDVEISRQNGWTIINDRASLIQWTFTPPDEPAYPAVVKRSVIERNGAVSVETAILCQAEKAACDALVVEFQQLNDEMRASLMGRQQTSQSGWSPSQEQIDRAEQTAAQFLQAAADGQYADAYAMYTEGMKAEINLQQYISLERSTIAELGSLPTRTGSRVTWYNDPPNASAPGVYAAFDFACQHPKLRDCAEILILHQQSDGRFLVMRQERNMVK
jgi:hypothetical protein